MHFLLCLSHSTPPRGSYHHGSNLRINWPFCCILSGCHLGRWILQWTFSTLASSEHKLDDNDFLLSKWNNFRRVRSEIHKAASEHFLLFSSIIKNWLQNIHTEEPLSLVFVILRVGKKSVFLKSRNQTMKNFKQHYLNHHFTLVVNGDSKLSPLCSFLQR